MPGQLQNGTRQQPALRMLGTGAHHPRKFRQQSGTRVGLVKMVDLPPSRTQASSALN